MTPPLRYGQGCHQPLTYYARGQRHVALLHHGCIVGTAQPSSAGRRHRPHKCALLGALAGPGYPRQLLRLLPLICQYSPHIPSPRCRPSTQVSAWKSGLRQGRGLRPPPRTWQIRPHGLWRIVVCHAVGASDASYMGYHNHAWYRDVVSLNPPHSRRIPILLTPVTFRSEYTRMFQSIDPAATPAPDPSKKLKGEPLKSSGAQPRRLHQPQAEAPSSW